MRNFIKYPPLEWCKNHANCSPQGPSFNWAPRTQVQLGGSTLQIKAPRHSPRRSTVEQVRVISGRDVLDDPQLGRFAEGVMANRDWGKISLLARSWAFYGPWMSGCKGELRMNATLIGRAENCAFSNISFFNPKAFEMVLVQYLNDLYGHENWENEDSHIPRHHGPVDWLRHNHFPVPSASFKIYNQGEDSSDLALPDHLFVFPVTDQHFVEVCFVQEYYSRDEKGDVAFDTAPLQELQENIFSSITLSLGPETQSRVDKVKAEVGDMQLCKTFAPLKWPTNIYPPEPSSASEMQKSLKAGC
ncbi:hypothetical protein [Microbulbifer hydrolyticus]|uniref:Uncharacterized protein n=1 Tax=Microbulbifer hydrolyticus TaxID=48074 RepID=A0A6P1TBR9_9GAMM|nr:hypothetical protein [Microbulbifer hydrolyticus]MBB5212601.1 hypothetical protein [Microbulbifer hydrolyticus]QHQ40214.1 hypothetical protein GTQ55_15320 [Microbulbifer hydrolyticus]